MDIKTEVCSHERQFLLKHGESTIPQRGQSTTKFAKSEGGAASMLLNDGIAVDAVCIGMVESVKPKDGEEELEDLHSVLGPPHYCTPLHLECAEGDIEGVKILLRYGVDMNQMNELTGDRPVHVVCAREEHGPDMLKSLMTVRSETEDEESCRKLDLSVRDRLGNTPLHLAIEKGNIACVDELVKDPEVDPNVLNWYYETPLHLILKRLLKHKSKGDYQDEKNRATLTIAKLKGCPPSRCIPIKLPANPDKDDRTVENLRKELSDPDLEDVLDTLEPEREVRAEHVLASLDDDEEDNVVLSKLDQVKKIGKNWEQTSPRLVMLCCKRGRRQILEKLLDLGVDPNLTCAGRLKKDNPSDDTAVMAAADYGRLDILKMLFDHPKIEKIDVSPVNGLSIFDRVEKGSTIYTDYININQNHNECIKYLKSRHECQYKPGREI